jgi:hypothetical protein
VVTPSATGQDYTPVGGCHQDALVPPTEFRWHPATSTAQHCCDHTCDGQAWSLGLGCRQLGQPWLRPPNQLGTLAPPGWCVSWGSLAARLHGCTAAHGGCVQCIRMDDAHTPGRLPAGACSTANTTVLHQRHVYLRYKNSEQACWCELQQPAPLMVCSTVQGPQCFILPFSSSRACMP